MFKAYYRQLTMPAAEEVTLALTPALNLTLTLTPTPNPNPNPNPDPNPSP